MSVYAESPSTPTSHQIVGTTYGAVAGRATDPLGGVLAGVTVTVSGISLMGPRVTTTAQDGNYLLPALPPGDYIVTFERAGFRQASTEVRVGAGFSATVDAILHMAALVESITVEPRSGVIDRHATAIAD